MIFNGFIPLNIYKAANSKYLHYIINVFRVLTLRPPYKKGQLETITYLKQITYGNQLLNKFFGYKNEMVEHLFKAFSTVPYILKPISNTLKRVDRNGNIPVLANIDFNSISPNGTYDWNQIKEILKREMSWKGTGEGDQDKGLHTSCVVEDGKDYSQFIRFRNMESMIIPFSAIELSNAVTSGNITREQAIEELYNMPGFNSESPEGHSLMMLCNGLPCNKLCGVYEK